MTSSFQAMGRKPGWTKSKLKLQRRVFIALPHEGEENDRPSWFRLHHAIRSVTIQLSLVCSPEPKSHYMNPIWTGLTLLSSSHVFTSLTVLAVACTSPGEREKLSTRISEHILRNLTLSDATLPDSSVARQSVDCQIREILRESFKVINKQNNPKSLRFGETSAIRCLRPSLWRQLGFVANLLAW